jgi:hypothetical protein
MKMVDLLRKRLKKFLSRKERTKYDTKYWPYHHEGSWIEDYCNHAVWDVGGRSPEDEPLMIQSRYEWAFYLKFLKWKLYSERTKRQWIKEEEVANCLVEVLNYIGMDKKTQELLIQKRPDLISQIKNLHPKLAKKYKDEINLSGIDI